jgi:hypothetical protein
VGSERFEVEKHLEEGGARVRGTRFVFVVAVTTMLVLAAGAASGQDEEVLPSKLDEDTTPEEGGEKNLDAEAQELTKEEALGPKAVGEAPTKEDTEKSGKSPEESSAPPTPSLASEGVPVSGNPTSGYETPEGTRVPTGAVSSGGLARLPATGGT